jgi:hypothetical protein
MKYTVSGSTLQYNVGLTLNFLSLNSRGVGAIQKGNTSIYLRYMILKETRVFTFLRLFYYLLILIYKFIYRSTGYRYRAGCGYWRGVMKKDSRIQGQDELMLSVY